jgi:fimbrial isopeptide formation D2 family protein
VTADDYVLTKVDDHHFTVRLDWGDGQSYIANEALNGAKVEVYFNATLNASAKLGVEGNVNAAKLTYSNNSTSDDEKDEEELPWDYVITFTYKADVSKVDPEGASLKGAEFALEKLIKGEGDAEGEFKALNTEVEVVNGAGEGENHFVATGLDDGIYRLTETKAPKGFKAIEPVTFTIVAGHVDAWDYRSNNLDFDQSGNNLRYQILTSLMGGAQNGTLDLTANTDLVGLIGDVVDEEHEKPSFEKKIMDANDSTGETSDWQDSADYDINDAVPYRLTATLPADVTTYKHYHITFKDQMEPSLTFNKIDKVTVNGAEVTDYEFAQADEQNFSVRLDWDGNGTYITDAALNGAKVEVLFSSILNENANLGKEGNINGAKLA